LFFVRGCGKLVPFDPVDIYSLVFEVFRKLRRVISDPELKYRLLGLHLAILILHLHHHGAVVSDLAQHYGVELDIAALCCHETWIANESSSYPVSLGVNHLELILNGPIQVDFKHWEGQAACWEVRRVIVVREKVYCLDVESSICQLCLNLKGVGPNGRGNCSDRNQAS